MPQQFYTFMSWHNSMRTPLVDFGCKNATSLLSAPFFGVLFNTVKLNRSGNGHSYSLLMFLKLINSSFSEVAQLAPPRPEVRRAGAQGVPRVVVVAQS